MMRTPAHEPGSRCAAAGRCGARAATAMTEPGDRRERAPQEAQNRRLGHGRTTAAEGPEGDRRGRGAGQETQGSERTREGNAPSAAPCALLRPASLLILHVTAHAPAGGPCNHPGTRLSATPATRRWPLSGRPGAGGDPLDRATWRPVRTHGAPASSTTRSRDGSISWYGGPGAQHRVDLRRVDATPTSFTASTNSALRSSGCCSTASA